jgi:hypothetical protein
VNRVRDFFGAIGDRVVVDGGHLVRRFLDALTWPFRQVAWGIQRWVIWPVQDRPAARTLAVVGVVAVAVGAGIAGAGLLKRDGRSISAITAAPAPESPVARVAAAPPEAPEPTLQGATPVFEPARKDERSSADSAKPGKSSAPAPTAGATSSAATGKISSTPSAKAAAVVPTPAGPEAIAVAQKFADAFVVYETGGVEPAVRETFGETATPQLSKALLRRPPRLPANVEVPEAEVMNVVAAPSRGPVYPVSVSLLRLGVTSELRLSMEQKKNNEWRVADVLG